MLEPTLKQYREFLKDTIRMGIDFSRTDQALGYRPPPAEKPCRPEACRVDLVGPGQWKTVRAVDLTEAIARRQSRRSFQPQPLTLEELSYLLWATQGVRDLAGGNPALRTVPSAGARHSLETYVLAFDVAGLPRGVYRYLPLEHQLLFEFEEEALDTKLVQACLGQEFVARAAATFVWSVVPYRMEWRYGLAAHRVIALDAGHVCQNLYLACEAIGAGTCAMAAYHQERLDRLLRLDGNEEFVLYLAPVGKV
jgi:SagB-type dehydrogenase family enzyme